jgi:AcrR family transcriptional regulator
MRRIGHCSTVHSPATRPYYAPRAHYAPRPATTEVATQLFLAEGYGSTTIEAVASRAGISKRTFYHRFDDKAALLAAVVYEIIGQSTPGWLAMIRTAPPQRSHCLTSIAKTPTGPRTLGLHLQSIRGAGHQRIQHRHEEDADQ